MKIRLKKESIPTFDILSRYLKQLYIDFVSLESFKLIGENVILAEVKHGFAIDPSIIGTASIKVSVHLVEEWVEYEMEDDN
jgi:hypothetical protein